MFSIRAVRILRLVNNKPTCSQQQQFLLTREISSLPQSDHPEVQKLFQPAMLDQKARTNLAVHDWIREFQKHKSDTGSASVQAMITTEKILNMTRHFLHHRKDKGSLRGFQRLLSHRKSMLNYLKRSDVESYKRVAAAIAQVTNGKKNAN
eukprot:scaffold3275_cov183-Ochromonas_danica.AAC.10